MILQNQKLKKKSKISHGNNSGLARSYYIASLRSFKNRVEHSSHHLRMKKATRKTQKHHEIKKGQL